MIPRSSKFPMRTLFVAFQKQAKQFVAPHFRLLYISHHPSRLSVVVPVKVSKKASRRADLRRLVYNFFWPTLKNQNLDCVVIFKPLSMESLKELSPKILSELKGFRV